ncbi:MAG: hypothetical protein HDS66_08380 [Bacteroidales bacterium]|nr:hypothetical protein [Bacteroidales bacterium]
MNPNLKNIFRAAWNFIANGTSVFALAAKGEYSCTTSCVERLHQELEEDTHKSGPAIDKEKLRQDRAMVSRDVDAAFRQYKSDSGYE